MKIQIPNFNSDANATEATTLSTVTRLPTNATSPWPSDKADSKVDSIAKQQHEAGSFWISDDQIDAFLADALRVRLIAFNAQGICLQIHCLNGWLLIVSLDNRHHEHGFFRSCWPGQSVSLSRPVFERTETTMPAPFAELD